MGQPGTVRVRLKSQFVIQENPSLRAVATASPMLSTVGMGALASDPSVPSKTKTAVQVTGTGTKNPAMAAAPRSGALPSGRRAFVAFHRRPDRPTEAATAR
jgi:hypothetical protein